MKRPYSFTLPDYLLALVLGTYFVVALIISADFGVNWDDALQRDIGKMNWNYITRVDKDRLELSTDKYHGPAFELILIGTEKALHLKDNYDIYTLRHRIVVVFFAFALLAFYLVGTRLFRNRWIALAGVLILILSPRIFAESCYNPKDIPFMGAMILAFYGLVAFIDQPDYKKSYFLAFSCAFALDIRVIGALMIPVSLYMVSVEVWQGRLEWKGLVKKSICCILIFAMCMIIFWPILIENPIRHLIAAYTQLSNYSLWLGYNLYMGTWYVADHTPWHYHFVWIAITTPEAYLLLFIIGLVYFIVNSFRRRQSYDRRQSTIWAALFIILFPLVFRAAKLSVVLDGWRHMYFVYPFMVLVMVYGLDEVSRSSRKISRALIYLLVVVGLSGSLVSIIRMHPYEYVYFNTTARKVFRPIDEKFDMDYWGISYRQGLEYILATDKRKENIKVNIYNAPGYRNLECLPPAERSRFTAMDDMEDADYYLSNYRMNLGTDSLTPFHTIRAQGDKVLGVFKLTPR
jgi:hypothetical protein